MKLKKPKYPSYWIGSSCKTCGSHVGRLMWWLPGDHKYAIRIVQPTCRCLVTQDHRTVTDNDVKEYLKRLALGEPTQ